MLERIEIKKNSLQAIHSLKICNNKGLKIIEIENGQRWKEGEKWISNGAFSNVKSVYFEGRVFNE